MPITLNDWAILGSWGDTYDIQDTVDNLLNNPLFNSPVTGPLLQATLSTLIGTGDATVTALVDGTNGLATLTPEDIAGLAAMQTSLLDPQADSIIPLSTVQDLVDAGISLVDGLLTTAQGTTDDIAGLAPNAISQLADAGVDILDAGGSVVPLALDQVAALADTGLELGPLDVGTLVDTGANIAAMTVDDITALLATGIRTVDVTDDAIYITVDQAKAFAAAETTFAPEDVVTVLDTAAHIEALTTSEIADIAGIGLDSIDSTGNRLALSLAQIDALTGAGIALSSDDVVTATDTAANLSALATGAIAALAANGIDAIDSTDDFLTLSLDRFDAFNNASIAMTAEDAVTVTGPAADFAALSPVEIANLAARGADAIDLADEAIALTVAQAKAYAAAGLVFAGDDVVRIADAGANIAALTANDFATLKAVGVDSIDASDNTVALSAAQATALADAGLSIAASDVVTLADTAANILALAPAELAGLKAAGIDIVDATDNAVSLTAARAGAFATAGLGFAADDVVNLVDTGANIAALTADQLAALKTIGVDSIDATDNAVSLTAAKAGAFAAAGLAFAADDVVSLVDMGANIAALAPSEIAGLGNAGIGAIDATDNTIALTLAQAAAMTGMAVTFADDDIVTLADSADNLVGLTASQIVALAAKGVDRIDATDNALNLTLDQFNADVASSIAFSADDVVTLADGGARLAGLSPSQIAALADGGVDRLDATDDAAIASIAQARAFATAGLAFAAADSVRLSDTGAGIAALAIGDIAALKAIGIDNIDVTDNAVFLTVAQAKAFAAAGIAFAEPGLALDSGDVVTLADTGAAIATLTAAEIAALKTTGIDALDATTNAAAIDADQAGALAAAGIGFAARDIVRLVDTGAEITAMKPQDFSALKSVGIDRIDSTTDAATLTLSDYKALGAILFANNDMVTVNGNNHANTMTAHGRHMTLHGMKGTDTLAGGAASDILAGGLGRDLLKGGSGRDEFLFDTRLGGANVDKVRGFDTARDHIGLDDTLFRAIGANLTKEEFHIGRAAHDRSDHIIYDKAHGTLYYDHDGKGHDAAVKFAILDKGLHLTASDFDIV